MIRPIQAFAFALLLIGCTGCTTVAQIAASTATSLSSSTPREVTTYAEATQAATLVTRATDIAVNTGKLDKATLVELNALRAGLRAAWDDLHAANDAGHSLTFASFNAALDAYNVYATTKGISH